MIYAALELFAFASGQIKKGGIMSVFKSIFILSFTCTFVLPIFAETKIKDIKTHDLDKYRTGFSLGVDDFPWNAKDVSLRWWQENGKGKELSIEKFYLTINKSGSETITSEESMRTVISFPNITYYLLSRSPSRFSENMYLVRGFGLGLSLDIVLRETTFSDIDKLINDIYQGSLSFHIPIGIEHFFWDKYPTLSYSIGFDLYGSIVFRYSSQNRNDTWQKTKEGTLNFGISSPKFFVRWCF